ncbi:unnamed protein product [Parnassius apollo]|uniref:(apollo) hypothetical protein n=1 Tax=Parnassius apollo TaxID=110799 RepID=A0A8S3Y8C9_PARAO|nr:unnamed protein product [Parnassius apollo]
MKSVAFFVLLAILVVSVQQSHGCIYVNGKCFKECEEGTISYTPGCTHLTKEATCDEPNPQPDTRGHVCDFSSCYCAPPTVRNTVTNKCVPLEECPKKE